MLSFVQPFFVMLHCRNFYEYQTLRNTLFLILDIQDNMMLWRSVQCLYASITLAVSGVLEPLNDLLQLAPFPSGAPEFKSFLMMILVSNLGCTYAIEYFCRKLE